MTDASKHSPRGISITDARRFLLALPNIAAGRSYGMPSFLLHGRFFARFRDDDTVLVLQLVTIAERDVLVELDPRAFFFTEHYRNYPAVLVHLVEVPQALFADVVRDAWHQVSAVRTGRPRAKGAAAGASPATSPASKRPPLNKRVKPTGRGGRRRKGENLSGSRPPHPAA